MHKVIGSIFLLFVPLFAAHGQEAGGTSTVTFGTGAGWAVRSPHHQLAQSPVVLESNWLSRKWVVRPIKFDNQSYAGFGKSDDWIDATLSGRRPQNH